IWSDIPKGVGLGSSAAVAVATTAAINNLFELHLDTQEISRYAYEAEKITHFTPSGIDNTISTLGGAILYKKGKINQIKIQFEIPLLIINSGTSHKTKTQVANVRNLYNEHPSIFKSIFQAIDAISLKVENILGSKKLEILGELLNYNQHLLRLIDVSTKELDSLIDLVKSHGAIGAKLTGAGGGGCIIALFKSFKAKNKCTSQLKSLDIEMFDTKISANGVKIQYTA
ncbi:MAG: mevalonate kinase, partial [Promethearchaeota archaeon]